MDLLDNSNELRSTPPRKMSFITRIKVLFDGYTMQIGVGLLGLGLILTQIIVGQSLFMELINTDGVWEQTRGRVLEYTSSGKEGLIDLYKYSFEFTLEGDFYQGTSYGPSLEGVDKSNCLIEYRSQNPRRSRIVGTSAEIFPTLAACFLFLPLLGIIFIIIGLKKNFKVLFLLKNGIFAKGKTILTKPTAALGQGLAYKFVFEFEVNRTTYQATCVTKEKEKVEDEILYKILYKESNPAINLVYDALEHIPEIGKLGEIKQEYPPSIFYLGIIAISLIINIYIYWSWYL